LKDLHGDADIINQKDDSNGKEERQCPAQIKVKTFVTLKYYGPWKMCTVNMTVHFYLNSKFLEGLKSTPKTLELASPLIFSLKY